MAVEALYLYFSVSDRGARCLICTTMQDCAQLIHAKLTQAFFTKLLGYSVAAPARVESLGLDDGRDDFRRRSLGTRFAASFRREWLPVFSFHQCCVKSEEGGRFQYDGSSAAGANQARDRYDKVDEQDGQITHYATIVSISAGMTRLGFCADLCDKIGIRHTQDHAK